MRNYLPLFTFLMSFAAAAVTPSGSELYERHLWFRRSWDFYQRISRPATFLEVISNHDRVTQNGFCGDPFRLAGRTYYLGLFCHAPSQVRAQFEGPATRFQARLGVDSNFYTQGGQGSIVFVLKAGDAELFRSPVMREGMPELAVDVALDNVSTLDLIVEDGGDGISCDQAAWAEARVQLISGEVVWLGDLPITQGQEPVNYALAFPFSFTYAGKPSSEFLSSWSKGDVIGQDDMDGHFLISQSFTDPVTHLNVNCVVTQFTDLPAVEWTVTFTNHGTERTPLLEDVQALDMTVQRYAVDSHIGEFVLRYNRGDYCNRESYEPQVKRLEPGQSWRTASENGRPTNNALPYWNLQWLGEGIILGLGWPGQWAASFERDKETGLHITAGQELTHFVLEPGESVRTPRVAMLFWKGDWVRAQNLWREWMRKYNMPHPDGELVKPLFNACSSHQFREMEQANEENQKLFVDRYAEERFKLDHWWMDAGWYIQDRGWPQTGTWEVDTRRFPNGLRAITDHAHAKGTDIIVWFEPERVTPETWLYNEHPEWLLGKDGEQKLLNLGDDDAREWLTQHVLGLLDSQGIDLYRQDFNIDPLAFWRANDTEDRQGITENKHATGYLAYWDALLQARPGMLIDSCASGGRRNDLDTLKRSVPQLRSDYIFEPVGQQGHTYGISFWMPFNGTGVRDTDPYLVRSCMTTDVIACWDLRRKDLPYDQMRKLMDEWREQAHHRLLGDYYPLTPYSLDDSDWIGWQFHTESENAGVVHMFRRANSAYEAGRFPLRGLQAELTYTLRDADAGEMGTASGESLLQEGPRLELAQRPGAVTLFYAAAAPAASPPATGAISGKILDSTVTAEIWKQFMLIRTQGAKPDLEQILRPREGIEVLLILICSQSELIVQYGHGGNKPWPSQRN